MPPTLRYEDETLRVVTDRRLCVIRWLDSPAARHFGEVTRAFAHAVDHSGGAAVGLFNVVDARGKLPRFNDEIRRAAGDMTRAVTPGSAGAAHVILVEGLAGVAVRMFLSTLTLLSRAATPTTIHSTVAEGATWLSRELAGSPTAAQIETAYALSGGTGRR
jgi:hypothetical protein